MSSQQLSKKRKNFSKTLKQQIKRKPHTQPINNIQYTYGLLQKKSESSLFGNQRLLIIKGNSTFGYASKLPDNVDLPFLDEENLPKCKIQVDLDKIDITNEKDLFIVQFQNQKVKGKPQKVRWEFKCGSKNKAIEWRQKLQAAKSQRLKNMQNLPIKVILEDPNQHLEESQNNLKKREGLITKMQEQTIRNMNYQNSNYNMKIEDDQQMNQPQIQQKRLRQQEKQQQKDVSEQKPFYQPSSMSIFDNLLNPVPKSLVQLQPVSQQTFPQPQPQKSTLQTAKQQYLLKKQQINQIQSQIKEENVFKNVLGTIMDGKFHIEKLKREWGYQFAKSINQHQVIQHFKVFVQTLTVKIVDQLSLDPKKRYYKPIQETSQSLKYQVQGVSLQFCLHQLQQVQSFQSKGTIIQNNKIKSCYQQLKNYQYILSITNNKGRLRVPLTICTQYKGFICMAKCLIPQSQSYQNIEILQKQLDLLQIQSRINNSLFQDSDNGRIVPLMNKVYQKLARNQGARNRFDFCYFDNLKYYLPMDFYHNNHKNNHFLRKELLKDQEYQETTFIGENMNKIINRIKITNAQKQAVELLTEVSKTIIDRVNALVLALQNLDQIVTNSKDLSNLMHGYGLNMRYLGLLLQKSKQNWLKSILMSEIASRCAKYFLKFDLQDCIINLNQTKLDSIRKYQVNLVISFFNKVLGSSQESEMFWNQLSKQSQSNFSCYLDKSTINTGFLLQSLQHHCRITLHSLSPQHLTLSTPLSIKNFQSFNLHTKTFSLQFTQLYHTILSHLHQESSQSYEQLSILLNLSRKTSLPQHFKINGFDQKIVGFLINWLSPDDNKHIYYPQTLENTISLPNKVFYQVKLTEIKWYLKKGDEKQAEVVRDFIVEHINTWLGENHPILTELYQLFSRFYMTQKSEEKKALNYCKTGIKNQQKLLGQNHIRLADSYYFLSEIYLKFQKKSQALNSLRRARQILIEADSAQSQAYGLITLKIGQLSLASNLTKQALDYAIDAYTKLSDCEQLENFVQCIELIGRCYEIDQNWSDYQKFSVQICSHLQLISGNISLLQKCLKTVLCPYLHTLSLNTPIQKRLTLILNSFSISTYSLNLGYQQLRQKILQKSFPNQFLKQLQQIQDILDEIQNGGVLSRWKGFQNVNSKGKLNMGRGGEFLLILQVVNLFLGEGFVEGSLRPG